MKRLNFRTKFVLILVLPLLASALTAIFVSANKLKTQGKETLERKTKAILSRMEAVRTYVATEFDMEADIHNLTETYPNGNIPKAEKKELLNRVPIIASMAVGKMDAEKDNYEFRIASLRPRNPENKATNQETGIIHLFENNASLADTTFVNKETNELWVARPVRLSGEQGCLACHGDPSASPWGNSKDILGYDMENYKDGDIEGIFILKSSLSANNSVVQANIKSAIGGITLLMSIIVALVLILAILFIKNTNRKISDIIKANKRIASGDLTKKIKVTANDEFGDIANHLNDVIDSIKDVVTSVNSVSTVLTNESSDTMEESRSLSLSSNNQAASVEEISASMEEMTATISQNLDNAIVTEKTAALAAKEIEEGNESSQKAIKSMLAIQDEIKVIEEIAKQTNILALNAAVEAARAGSAGAGFAVVAAEVRKLAEKSRVSADLISTVFSEGVETVNSTGVKLAEIVPEIQKTSTLIAEVAASSNEQTTGANEINAAIQNLNNVTQENASIANRMSEKAGFLLEQAKLLQERISFFKAE